MADGNNALLSTELQMAVSELEKAKGYKNVIAAIDRCKKFYGEFFPHIKLTLDLDLTCPIISRSRRETNPEWYQSS